MSVQTRLSALALVLAAAFGGVAHAAHPFDTDREFSAAEYAAFNAALAEDAEAGTPPLMLRGYVPLYPASRILAGMTGECVLEFTIDATGKAADIVRAREDDRKMCDHAVLALRHWEFQPAMRDGSPQATRHRVPITYSFE